MNLKIVKRQIIITILTGLFLADNDAWYGDDGCGEIFLSFISFWRTVAVSVKSIIKLK